MDKSEWPKIDTLHPVNTEALIRLDFSRKDGSKSSSAKFALDLEEATNLVEKLQDWIAEQEAVEGGDISDGEDEDPAS